MIYKKFKLSALHNLKITKVSLDSNLNEGILIPTNILEKANLFDGQEVIITRIGGNSWKNRIRTFVIENKNNSHVEVRGSLANNFLKEGDLTCLIAECYLSENEFEEYKKNKFAIFDLGFDAHSNVDNTTSILDLQFSSYKEKNVNIDSKIFSEQIKNRSKLLKVFAQSIIIGLRVNKTHPDCLQGSAELPKSVMEKAGMCEYKSVSVYNSSMGGVADTYSVPMPENVVMTTGAMASFAKIGEIVNVVGYVLSENEIKPTIVYTDGNKCVNI